MGEPATVTLSPELTAGLDRLAARSGRSRAELATEAVAEYLAVQDWQVAGIEEALREADSGAPGIPHERVAAWVASWDGPDELPMPEAR
jgi:predicted transcriptional regulator